MSSMLYVDSRAANPHRPLPPLPPMEESEYNRVFEHTMQRLLLGEGREFRCESDDFNATLLHLERDGWKLDRLRTSVTAAGVAVDLQIWPGFVVRDRVEEFEHFMKRGMIAAPKAKQNMGNVGAALAHVRCVCMLCR